MKKDKWYLLMILPSIAFIGFFIFYPLISGGMMAFQSYNLFNLKDIKFVGLENFKAIIFSRTVSFTLILKNTLKWLVLSLVFQFLLGFTLALLLRKPFRGRSVYCGFVFYSWALCGFAIGLIWTWLFNGQFGVINDLLMKVGIIRENVGWLSNPKIAMYSVVISNVWYGVPYFGIMLLAALQSVPNELYEAATIDGSTKVQQLFHVTIPYIKPTIISTVLLRSMWIVNFPDLIYAMTNGGPVNSTHILGTMMINKVYKEFDYGQGSAYGVVIMVLLLVYAVIYLRITRASEVAGMISRIAMCGGAGSDMISDALAAGAQMYLSGDISYHNFFTPDGLMIMDIGHFESEIDITGILFSVIRKKFPNFAVRVSERMENPVRYC